MGLHLFDGTVVTGRSISKSRKQITISVSRKHDGDWKTCYTEGFGNVTVSCGKLLSRIAILISWQGNETNWDTGPFSFLSVYWVSGDEIYICIDQLALTVWCDQYHAVCLHFLGPIWLGWSGSLSPFFQFRLDAKSIPCPLGWHMNMLASALPQLLNQLRYLIHTEWVHGDCQSLQRYILKIINLFNKWEI